MHSNFQRYTLKTGIDDYQRFRDMIMQWFRITSSIRDYNSAVKINRTSWKRKVSDAQLKEMSEEIDAMMLDFETEYKIPYHAKYEKMFK